MANRRERKTDHGISDFNALLDAIKAIKIEKKTIRETSRAFFIDKSSLSRYIKKFDQEVEDITKVPDRDLLGIVRRIGSYATTKQVFDEEQEKALVEYIVRCCRMYYGLSITELRELAYQYARKLNITYPPNWDKDQMAGKTWYYGFMYRHRNLEPSIATTSAGSASRSKSLSSLLSDIGPVQQTTPRKKSNRGRKPGTSRILTSPENFANIKEKQQKRQEKAEKKKEKEETKAQKRKISPQKETPTKPSQPTRAAKKKSSSSSEEDVDFCLICMKMLPARMTKNNSIECNKCKRPFHLKCVNMSRSYFTCQNCDSDADLSE